MRESEKEELFKKNNAHLFQIYFLDKSALLQNVRERG